MAFWRRKPKEPEIERAISPSYAYYQSTYGTASAEKILPIFEQFACYGYQSNSVVFSVISRRMSVLTEATFKWRNLSDKKLFGNQDLALLETPWPNGSTGDLIAIMEIHGSLAGNAYIARVGGRLIALRPDWVTIVSQVLVDDFGHEYREVTGYFYDPVGDSELGPSFFTVDEVAHWAPNPNPLANFIGMSWLSTVVREISGDIQMAEYREKYFKNAAMPNLLIRYQADIKPQTIERIEQWVEAKHTGPENAFSTLVLDKGGEATVIGNDMIGSAFDALQAAGETRIAAAGGVPALVAGLRQGMQASAIGEYQQGMRAFADLTARPLWRGICRALQKLVVVPPGAELWYDTTDVSALQQGEQDKAATLQQLASTMSTWIMAGYEPESVTRAAVAGDPSLLIHSGLVSVQLYAINGMTKPPPITADVTTMPQMNGKTPMMALPAGGSNG